MATVTISRRQESFRRTINGAWVGAGTETTTHENVPESDIRNWIVGGGLCCFSTVIWPDGHKESARLESWGPVGYGPRLEALFRS